MTDDLLLEKVESLQAAGDLHGLCDLYVKASEPQRAIIRDAVLLIHSSTISEGYSSTIPPKHLKYRKEKTKSPLQIRSDVFRDTGITIYAFYDQILVECERCSHLAEVRCKSLSSLSRIADYERRLVCESCGFSKVQYSDSIYSYCHMNLSDPFFLRPLWLQTSCCGETLWAFNGHHLDVLERFVAAQVRESATTYRSMVSKLPAWIQKGKNREKVLAGIEKLRKRLLD